MTQTLAANWLNISINLLLVIHVIVCLLLALVVLMQRPKQEGLGAAFGGGLTDQAFGAQTTNVLQKGTVYLGTMFFVVTLILAILIGKRQTADPSMAESATPAVEEQAGPASESLDEGEEDDVTMPGEETPEATPAAPTPPAEPTPPAAEEGANGGAIGAPGDAQSGGAAVGAVLGARLGEPAEDKPEDKKPEQPEAPASGGTTGSDQ